MYERLIWFLVEVALTYDSAQIFDSASPNSQSAKDTIIAALEQFSTPEPPQGIMSLRYPSHRI